MLKYWFIFFVAFTSSIVFTFLLAGISLRYKILTVKEIPLVGGPGIGIAFILSVCLGIFVFSHSAGIILVVTGVCLLSLLFGIIDDIRELSVRQKLSVQSFCAILLILFGIRTDIMYLGYWGNAVITFFWILGITNTLNLLDIMDGLAVGTALIISNALLLIGFLTANLNVQILSLILCAVSAGFLIFNFPPAKIYLGNSGSHFLGLLIASIVLIAHYASSRNIFALLSPVVILGLPIMDTVLLIIFRLIKKKIPFKKSKDHIAFKIRALGFSKVKTIFIMYSLCFIFAICGVVLTMVSNLFTVGIIIIVFLFSIGMLQGLAKIETNG